MAQKKITDLTLRDDFDASCNMPTDDASQTWRVTGEQMKDFFKEEIAPIDTLGEILYAGAAGVPTALAPNTAAVSKVLEQTGTGSVGAAPTWREIKAPTVQKFTSSAGTYTTPAGAMYLRVRMVGGGGGGSSSYFSGTSVNGSAGTASTFGSQLSAGGGSGGGIASGGPGGTASLGTGPIGTALTGGSGAGAVNTNVTSVLPCGGQGGASAFGGGGASAANSAGSAGATNTGGGGGGGGGSAATGGGGGGAGGFIDALITGTLAATYAYSVGSGGGPGVHGNNGGGGASGYIEVTEYYQ